MEPSNAEGLAKRVCNNSIPCHIDLQDRKKHLLVLALTNSLKILAEHYNVYWKEIGLPCFRQYMDLSFQATMK